MENNRGTTEKKQKKGRNRQYRDMKEKKYSEKKWNEPSVYSHTVDDIIYATLIIIHLSRL